MSVGNFEAFLKALCRPVAAWYLQLGGAFSLGLKPLMKGRAVLMRARMQMIRTGSWLAWRQASCW